MGALKLNLPNSPSVQVFRRNRQRKLLYAGLSLVFLLVLWGTLLISSGEQYVGLQRLRSSDGLSLEAIKNETLGFEKIFCINLPSRSDKRDAITLGSSVTQFRVDWIDGVSSEDMSPKAYPPRYDEPDRPRMLSGEIGSWRAHLNAMQRIVSERISNALILEDDVDWDVTLKNQLQEFALGTLSLQAESHPKTTPYGDDWDILWLGHCGTKCQKNTPFYILKNDPTSIPVYGLPQYWAGPAVHQLVDNIKHNRIICKAAVAVCCSAYAVSFHAAQKILAALSVLPDDESMPPGQSVVYDVMLGRLCESGYLRCISSHPSVFGNWKGAGLPSKASDIQYNYDGPREQKTFEGASFQGLVYSTMNNLGTLLDGGSVVVSGVDDVMKPKLDLTKVKKMEGGLHVLDYEEMVLSRVG
ncbi:hypothetical protein ASPBRDRAFT_129902 [Aspergillus brasiliensis CBS 101740]|uniref:Glycosyl transferase family 25 domain-containing protein n=1 Tax=Aspergillus brasiliensis (strain CBS 101740 / IMI 381727 / IBT 21946) TaxID=767769 RepID=A0A1L9UDW6_ASPBC|nr:hypothetical protein ASPBRDRAFT_129902 [Aspergillus brasiliensis CBS 101740]